MLESSPPEFWNSTDADRYGNFSTTIPSDTPAYAVVHHLLQPQGKELLDFGCYQGQSSKNLLDSGAVHVTGIDNVAENINRARLNFHDQAQLTFLEIGTNEPLPQPEQFDAASMTFVHPTIYKKKDLETSLRKINHALRPNGRLVMLGLHPASFADTDYRFLYYGHKLRGTRRDGAPFDNELRLPDGQSLCFTDYFWSTPTLLDQLDNSHFTNHQVLDLTHDLPGPCGNLLRAKIAQASKVWLDEWRAPLYQIITSTKQ